MATPSKLFVSPSKHSSQSSPSTSSQSPIKKQKLNLLDFKNHLTDFHLQLETNCKAALYDLTNGGNSTPTKEIKKMLAESKTFLQASIPVLDDINLKNVALKQQITSIQQYNSHLHMENAEMRRKLDLYKGFEACFDDDMMEAGGSREKTVATGKEKICGSESYKNTGYSGGKMDEGSGDDNMETGSGGDEQKTGGSGKGKTGSSGKGKKDGGRGKGKKNGDSGKGKKTGSSGKGKKTGDSRDEKMIGCSRDDKKMGSGDQKIEEAGSSRVEKKAESSREEKKTGDTIQDNMDKPGASREEMENTNEEDNDMGIAGSKGEDNVEKTGP